MSSQSRARLVLAVAVLAGLLLAHLAARTPAPSPVDAPPPAFSAGRAMDDVRAIARRPHPSGSAENRRVRDYLVARLRSLGLEVRLQDSAAERPISNIVAVLPGTDRTLPAVTLMAHYDSVADSPGAADDAAGVAAALEIARAIGVGGRPRRDLLVLLTDGEEAGLLGARAFFRSDPLARRVGVVLNMEARGGGGRAFMFETSAANGRLVGLYGRAAERPSSTSLAVYLYDLMPNGTDFTIPKRAGIAGLNWAFIGRPGQYHHASSTPEALDQGSLQHLGDQVLPVTRALLTAERLPPSAPNAVYSDLLGAVLLAYPAWAGWLVLAAALGLAALGWRERPPWRDLGLGVLAGAMILVLSAVALRLTLIAASFAGRRPMLESFGLYELALALACAAPVLLIFRLLTRGRERSPAGVWLGLVLLGLALTAALQALEPTTAHTVAWPTLLACAAGAVAARRPTASVSLLAIGAASAVALGQLGAWAHGIALGVGDFLPEPLALFALLATIPLAPLLLMALQPRPNAV
jgi:hypothetical protein